MSQQPLIEVKSLKQFFPVQKGFLRKTVGYVKAVNDVSFQIFPKETLGMVGESGCGKSTLGRTMIRLYEPTAGEAVFNHDDQRFNIFALERKEMRMIRANMQMIFQDPFSSLNERMTVLDNIIEPLVVNKIGSRREREEKAEYLLTEVGLRKEHLRRYPHSFSGGQRQRIGIARALSVSPKFIVADEPVFALDVSIQAQILNLLKKLQSEFDLTFLFISHDLSVIRYMADRIAVMYVGKMVELASRDEVLANPLHPYTEALLSAVPRPNRDRRTRIVLKGSPPDPSNLPPGCVFAERCSYAKDLCRQKEPELRELVPGHQVSCHFADSLSLRGVMEDV